MSEWTDESFVPNEASFVSIISVANETLLRITGEASTEPQPCTIGTCPSSTGKWKRFVASKYQRYPKGKKRPTWETIMTFLKQCGHYPYVKVYADFIVSNSDGSLTHSSKTIFYRRHNRV